MLQYPVHREFVAARYFDIIYKNAAFVGYECPVDIIGIVGNELYPLLIIQVAVVFGIGLVAIYLRFGAGFFTIRCQEAVEVLLEMHTEVVGCSRQRKKRAGEYHDLFLSQHQVFMRSYKSIKQLLPELRGIGRISELEKAVGAFIKRAVVFVGYMV